MLWGSHSYPLDLVSLICSLPPSPFSSFSLLPSPLIKYRPIMWNVFEEEITKAMSLFTKKRDFSGSFAQMLGTVFVMKGICPLHSLLLFSLPLSPSLKLREEWIEREREAERKTIMIFSLRFPPFPFLRSLPSSFLPPAPPRPLSFSLFSLLLTLF